MNDADPPKLVLKWFIPADLIGEGRSAVLGHPVMFYIVHITALLSMFASMFGAAGVIAHIYRVRLPGPLCRLTGGLFEPWGTPAPSTAAKPKRLEFAARFAMYLAVADGCWSLSHTIDHSYLLINRVFPSEEAGLILGTMMWIGFGYHQLMHACLSFITWLRVCRETKLDFGRFDWKLHSLCLGIVVAGAPILYYFRGFGLGGYWCVNDNRTVAGTVLTFMVTLVCATNALATTVCNSVVAKRLNEVSAATSAKPATKAPPLTGVLARIINSRVMDSTTALKRGSVVSTSSATDSVSRRDSSMTGCTTAPSSTIPRGGDTMKRGSRSEVGTGSGSGNATGSGSGNDSSSPAAAAGSAGPSPSPSAPSSPGPSRKHASKGEKRSLVASLCLNNLIRTASFVYIPLTIAAVGVTTAQVLHLVDPLSCLFAGVFSTAAGWINAYAYFQNERLKLSMRSS
ncbi:hypothetical protein H9P43_005182 [Blastocladiella emersonii ATCC 22665]|nr:hypothetical protein H9P43_005182 [Blastocladiella emersonii ATCC 22665]